MARSTAEVRMHKAIAAYLKTIGWKPLITGGISIAKVGSSEDRYEFRLGFLGRKIAPKVKSIPKTQPTTSRCV